MNESLFNDASLTNLHVVMSTISTYSCPWIQTSLTCAPAQYVVFPLLHTDQMQCSCTLYAKKYTSWLLTVSFRNLSAILLKNPLNTVIKPFDDDLALPNCNTVSLNTWHTLTFFIAKFYYNYKKTASRLRACYVTIGSERKKWRTYISSTSEITASYSIANCNFDLTLISCSN